MTRFLLTIIGIFLINLGCYLGGIPLKYSAAFWFFIAGIGALAAASEK